MRSPSSRVYNRSSSNLTQSHGLRRHPEAGSQVPPPAQDHITNSTPNPSLQPAPPSLHPRSIHAGSHLTSSAPHLPSSMTSVHCLALSLRPRQPQRPSSDQVHSCLVGHVLASLLRLHKSSAQPFRKNETRPHPCFNPPLLFQVRAPLARAHGGHPISPLHPLAHRTPPHWSHFQSPNSPSLFPLSASNAPLPTRLPDALELASSQQSGRLRGRRSINHGRLTHLLPCGLSQHSALPGFLPSPSPTAV